LKEDIDQFVDLKPSFYQLSPLTPCPGTALYDRMLEEDRIFDNYEWKDFTLWKDDVFELANFAPGQIKEFFDYAHEQIRDKLGPPPLQALESMLDLYASLKDQPDEYHQFLAERARTIASGTLCYVRPVVKHHASPEVRERAKMLERRYHEEIGRHPFLHNVVSRYLTRKIGRNIEAEPQPKVSDPPVRWSYYHTFDARVWVRKGRDAKKPTPYKDRRVISVANYLGQ
jgi:haloalkane dehalogenase